MADVTISQLSNLTPVSSAEIPISNNNVTGKAQIGSLQVNYNSIRNRPFTSPIVIAVPDSVSSESGLPNESGGYYGNIFISSNRQHLMFCGRNYMGLSYNYPAMSHYDKIAPAGNLLSSLSSFKWETVYCGYQFMVAMTNEKRIFCGGYFPYGNGVYNDQLPGSGWTRFSTEFSVTGSSLVSFGGAAAGTNIKSVYCSFSNQGNYPSVFIIGTDNRLYGFGNTGYGVMMDTSGAERYRVGYLNLANVSNVRCQGSTSLALLTDGTCRTAGYGGHYQMGDGTANVYNYTWRIPIRASDGGILGSTSNGGSPVRQIEVCGGWADASMYAVTNTNQLFAWGYNGYGQLGDSTVTAIQQPKLITTNVGKIYIGGGNYHSAMYTTPDRRYLFAAGYNGYGQLGNGNTTQQQSFVQVFDANSYGGTKIKKVIITGTGSYSSTYILLDNSRIFACGYMPGSLANIYNDYTDIGTHTSWIETNPAIDYDDENIIDIGHSGISNEVTVFALTSRGRMHILGYSTAGKMGYANQYPSEWKPYWSEAR